jgi:kynurenine 3-monooxygenase
MNGPVTILGAGCTGPLLGALLARRGLRVRIFEKRADPRAATQDAGRSINLALAARGLTGLRRAGLEEAVRPLLVPMHGRMLHDLDGSTHLLPYGQRPEELLWSVSRATLNHLLLDAAAAAGVELHFGQSCVGADFARGIVLLRDAQGVERGEPMTDISPVIGADGAASGLRAAMVRAHLVRAREEFLAHDYKELRIGTAALREHPLEREALHIWPRGGYMLIALPNADGTFTATLFLPRDGPSPSFASLATGDALRALFAREFPDALALLPDLEAQFAAHPSAAMGTVYAAPWHVRGSALLIGDAAHAIVPFHGQGMNCAFEDCVLLDELLDESASWPQRFARFDAERREDTQAIARMAIENYTEMRDTVRDLRFQLQKEISLELERRHPERFIPRYAMVMFHAEIPYAIALERGAEQARILERATATAMRLSDIDWPALEREVVAKLTPLPAARAARS